jgi:hypothetical protein
VPPKQPSKRGVDGSEAGTSPPLISAGPPPPAPSPPAHAPPKPTATTGTAILTRLGHFCNPSTNDPEAALPDHRHIGKKITQRGEVMQAIVFGISWDDPKRLVTDPSADRRNAPS